MIDFISSIFGIVTIKLVSASPEMLLTKLIDNGISVKRVSFIDELTLVADIQRKDFSLVSKISQNECAALTVLKKDGMYWEFLSFFKRPVLALSLFLYLIASVWLPTRVLFIKVTGNHTVSTQQILEAARCSGVYFGASREQVRSERAKNTIIGRLPELQWIGVTTKGSVAYITVREKTLTSITPPQEFSGICASSDGIVTEITVTRGNPLVKKGDTVEKGDILVSGYTDCGISLKAEQAEAEIYADTEREITALSPTVYAVKNEQESISKKYSILIGKKLINFFKDSGILGTGCDRICKSYVLTLPGGFQLPFALICWTEIRSGIQTAEYVNDGDFAWMSPYLHNYLRSDMIAGEIKEESLSGIMLDGFYSLEGIYSCNEMIGRNCTEEFIPDYGKRN